MLGTRTLDDKMEGADESTELSWHPNKSICLRLFIYLSSNILQTRNVLYGLLRHYSNSMHQSRRLACWPRFQRNMPMLAEFCSWLWLKTNAIITTYKSLWFLFPRLSSPSCHLLGKINATGTFLSMQHLCFHSELPTIT